MARLRVEVVLALAARQEVVRLRMSDGCTAADAVAASGLAADGLRFGIGGREVPADRMLCDGDRVELLRPLGADPRELRRQRARGARRR